VDVRGCVGVWVREYGEAGVCGCVGTGASLSVGPVFFLSV